MDMARVNYKCTVPDDKWATKQHLGVCLLTSIIDEQVAEARSL